MDNRATCMEEQHLNEFVKEFSERLALRSKLLESNLSINGRWPDETFFVKKDSSLKRNTAFVKKVRIFLDSQKEALLNEFEALNLSKYVEEVATSVVEAKIKTTDIPFLLKLCSAMYQRYADFSSLFLDAWKKVFSVYKDTKHSNLSKLRMDLALFADLNTIGIFRESEGMRLLASQLTQLTSGDMENFSNIGIICSFCRHCSDDWIGLIPRRIRLLSEKYGVSIPRSTFMPAERQAKCRAMFQDYLANGRRHLQNMAKDARRIIMANREQLENRGEVSEERQERANQMVATCRKFHESLCVLADLLDSDPPPDFNSMVKEDSTVYGTGIPQNEKEMCSVSSQLFEDEDTRLFYESLPDIKAMVPGILYKESEQAKTESCRESMEDVNASSNEDIDVDTVESELATEEALYKGPEDSDGLDRDKPPVLTIDDADEDPNSSGKVLMETFLTQLPNCVNRDLIDRAAIDFCLNLNKRSNRKRLARALLMVPRTRYDLLPFYARLVAALSPVMPDLVLDVNTMLTSEFRWRASKRDQLNLESKLKTVRFIGELVKFRVYPAHQALMCLKQLLPQFVHHNIEMACALLDTCGRFLYRLPISHQRTKVYLEVMLRKKTALHMDQCYSIMIENTYYYCNPPTSTRQLTEVVQLTPTMQYLRRLLWLDLDRTTVNNVLRSFRKSDWENRELVDFMEILFTRAWDVRFTNINCLASVLSGLTPFHRDFAIAVVDNVIEDIRVGMELGLVHLNQRRISMVKYLGLLYNYCLIDSPVIFKMLYSLLTFGVSLDENFLSPLDPPDSLFRIVLICTLLETSGGFFDRGKKRRKLNIFFIYFQRYYWFKRSLPIWVQAMRTDLSAGGGAVNIRKHDQSVDHPDTSKSESDLVLSDDTPPSNLSPAGTRRLAGNTTTDTQPPILPICIPFPSAVEQQYNETLTQLRLSVSRAHNFPQAQRLVNRLEARYLPKLARLKATYGLMGDSNTEDANGHNHIGDKSSSSNRPTGPGHMDTIAEEAEPGEDLPLDEEDYVVDDEDDDDDDDDVDDRINEGEDRGCRRIRSDQMEPDGNTRRLMDTIDENQPDLRDEVDRQLTPKQIASDEDQTNVVDSEEERAIRMGLKPRYIDCPEDAEFREALDKMTAEALLLAGPSGTGANVVGSAAEAVSGTIRPPVGSVLPAPDTLQLIATRTRTSSNHAALSSPDGQTSLRSILSALRTKSDEENCSPARDVASATHQFESTESENTVVFNLITRRGNRPHLVPLAVPDTVQFAARYMQAEAAEREEKARMKQLVLEMHEAQKEEEMEWGHLGSQDAVLAHQFPINVNRDRWVKYSHPKGAPDADAVFGTSSQRR